MIQETVSVPRQPARLHVNSTTGLLIAFLLMCLLFSLLAPGFFTTDNLVTISNTVAVVGIAAIGETMVLVAGGVDLSVGSTAALVGVVWYRRLPRSAAGSLHIRQRPVVPVTAVRILDQAGPSGIDPSHAAD